MSLEPADEVGADALDLSMAISQLAANSSDVSIMLKALVSELASALGNRLEVQRSGGVLRKKDEIKSVRITLDSDTLQADIDGGSVRCTIGRTSGGIRIRNEQVTMEAWLTKLLTTLRDEAAHSEQTRLALEHIVIGDNP